MSDKSKRQYPSSAIQFLSLGCKKLKGSRKNSGVKRADAEKVLNHQVDRRDLARAPQDGGSVFWPGALRVHAY